MMAGVSGRQSQNHQSTVRLIVIMIRTELETGETGVCPARCLEESEEVPPSPPRRSTESLNKEITSRQEFKDLTGWYKVCKTRTAQAASEINLEYGQFLRVSFVFNDGWCIG